MPVMKVTNEELLLSLQKTNSPTELAKIHNISIRSMIKRLRALGVPPLEGPYSSVRRDMPPVYINKAEGRIDFEIENGVVLVASDAHYFPDTISTAHKIFVKLIKDLKPKAVIMNGDIFDGASISRYPRIGWDSKPNIKQELKAVNDRLAEVESAAKGALRIWPLGNHDARFETYLAANAAQFEGVKGFGLKDHFPAWRGCWAAWINKDTVIKHRWKGGIHATRNNTLNSGVNIVTGHLHSLKVTPLSDYNGTRFGVDTGTLADPYGPQFSDYTEINPTDWRSGFIVLTFHNSRLLWPEVVHVLGEGVAEFRGNIIEV